MIRNGLFDDARSEPFDMPSATSPSLRAHATLFAIPKMDCPSEEQIVRMALQEIPAIGRLHFDLEARTLEVWHSGSTDEILQKLQPLGFGARLEHSREVELPPTTAPPNDAAEARVLRQLLVINAAMFVVEMVLGLVAESTGLIADSLDMFADATVYGLSLAAVGRALASKKRAARVSGWLQLLLALGVLGEVGRRALLGSAPVEGLMIAVATLALLANLACIALLARHRHGGVHLQASWLFTANDALANLGVVLAGGLVWWTHSAWPDLLIGTIVAGLVLGGAVRILRLT